MQNKIKQAILLLLLIMVITTMILQYIYFGKSGYWLTVFVLLIAWAISKWLQKQNT